MLGTLPQIDFSLANERKGSLSFMTLSCGVNRAFNWEAEAGCVRVAVWALRTRGLGFAEQLPRVCGQMP